MRGLFALLSGLLLLCGCEAILGLEERKLDIGTLTVDGYEGCQPSDGVCGGCTSDWHRCICEGWKKKDEAQLRVDCAELAPKSVRSDEIRKAEKSLETSRQKTEPVIPFLTQFDQEFCQDPPADDACLQCFCGDCGDMVEDCADDGGCRAIMTCFMESDCDPTEKAGAGGCGESDACSGVIAENGSLSGASYEKFRSAITCVAEQACPCGEAPPNEPPSAVCDPKTGCQCGTCWERCFCEGKDQGQCQRECGNANCVPERECSNCVDCMDSCLCAGQGDPSSCNKMCMGAAGNQCAPNNQCNCPDCFSRCRCEGRGNDTCLAECSGGACNPDTGCGACLDCFSRCICEGGDNKSCLDICPPIGVCDPGSNCQGCTTCLGSCACEGRTPFHECLTVCDLASCGAATNAPDCATCSTCASKCGCEGKGELDCRTECVTADCHLTFSEPCDQCACDRCGTEFAACNDEPGCPNLMGCITRTGCVSPQDCARTETCQKEVQALGGVNSPRMGLVEALQSCRQREGCACGPGGTNQPPGHAAPITCGANECQPFVPPPPDPIASACCAGAMKLCGLEMNSIFGTGSFCAPLSGPGMLSEKCPDHVPDVAPWAKGEVLVGCCRPDGKCGYQDFVLNLGCAPSEAFGFSAASSCIPE